MFEDSLVESVGRIRTRSRRYVLGSFLAEAALVAVIILIPYLYPAALPRQYLTVPLIEPPRAPAPATAEQHVAAPASRPRIETIDFTAPSRIPTTIPHIVDPAPGPVVVGSLPGSGPGNGVPAALSGIGPSPVPEVHAPKPTGPIRISKGVAAGQLIAPIRPVYPTIAVQMRLQGTVVVEATISAQGTVENLRVVSGSPILANAAVAAIRAARYRPYLLNGTPVEVETTINVVFSLDNDSQT
ncbi:MAG TPA: TonB family protein [Acidobacteriaceae bacterium]|nr:TonB family protein [Acidobacteriaceae bacterium]